MDEEMIWIIDTKLMENHNCNEPQFIPAQRYKGICRIRGKYVEKIVFQKKAYYLGIYDDIEQAVKVCFYH